MPFRMSDNRRLPGADWTRRGFSMGRRIREERGVLGILSKERTDFYGQPPKRAPLSDIFIISRLDCFFKLANYISLRLSCAARNFKRFPIQ